MTQQFQGNIPVSLAKQVFRGQREGRPDIVKQSIVNEGLEIQEDQEPPVESNSEIIFGPFPEAFEVKGLVHDAAVTQYAREQEFRQHGAEPSEEQILELLEGSIDGSATATPQLRNRVNKLEEKYGLNTSELLEYRFGDTTVQGMLQDFAKYRAENWQEDTAGFHSINTEIPVSGQGLSGRTDLRMKQPGQIREIKIKESTDEEDRFKASAYWLIDEDSPELVLEYPLMDERLEFDPESDTNDFDPREYAFDVYSSRDRAVELIDELRGLQAEYFDSYDSREKATAEALRDLQV